MTPTNYLLVNANPAPLGGGGSVVQRMLTIDDAILFTK